MAKELERKFILNELPQGLEYKNIKQAYLMFDGNQHLRVRIIDDKEAWLTFKVFHSIIVRTEYEYAIPLKDAAEMFNSSNCKLEKKRYSTEYMGNKVDIDVYPSGKSIVELEFEEELVNIPPYCGKEVTGMKEWSNVWIAMNEKDPSPLTLSLE